MGNAAGTTPPDAQVQEGDGVQADGDVMHAQDDDHAEEEGKQDSLAASGQPADAQYGPCDS